MSSGTDEVTADQAESPRRLSSDERRKQILLAAIAVFGARGYVGATTDEVARAAGVSQPYVVRLFGSKENLFLAAMEEALAQLMTSFRGALTESDRSAKQQIGDAYVDLLRIRGLHQILSHAYLLGGHPVIGPAARQGFTMIWGFFREEVGLDAEEARGFMAEGMLISTMIGLRLADNYSADPEIEKLFLTCFATEVGQVLDLVPRGNEPW